MTSRREIDEEFQFHMERLVRHLEETEGLLYEDALVEAEKRFGNSLEYAEKCAKPTPRGEVNRRGNPFLYIFNDLRKALRSSKNNPGFSAVAIITLALGIGVTTAIYSVFQGVLLRPLPFTAPEELAELGEVNPLEGVRAGGGGVSRSAFEIGKKGNNRLPTSQRGSGIHRSLRAKTKRCRWQLLDRILTCSMRLVWLLSWVVFLKKEMFPVVFHLE